MCELIKVWFIGDKKYQYLWGIEIKKSFLKLIKPRDHKKTSQNKAAQDEFECNSSIETYVSRSNC
jgi:hypothetical protein